MIEKLLSGGQSGVDRAALDVAMALGIAVGGWCPKGRKAEDGVIAPRYPLQETPAANYAQRTNWNVRDADGTLILTFGVPRGGTALTVACAKIRRKPLHIVDFRKHAESREVIAWIGESRIESLNVAGPRESQHPGIFGMASALLLEVLAPVCGFGPADEPGR